CERLGLTPVDPAFLERLTAPFELAHELWMRREAFRNPQELFVEGAQSPGGDCCDDLVPGRGGDVCVVARRNLRLSERLLKRLVRLTQLGQDIRIELVCLRLRDVALGHEALCELLSRS